MTFFNCSPGAKLISSTRTITGRPKLQQQQPILAAQAGDSGQVFAFTFIKKVFSKYSLTLVPFSAHLL
jgi:hypothetical protein